MKFGFSLLLLCACISITTSAYSQTAIARSVDAYDQPFTTVETGIQPLSEARTYNQLVSRSVEFTIPTDLRNAAPETGGIQLRLPSPDGDVDLKLIPSNILADGYRVETSSGAVFESTNRHFKGYIEGNDQSVAAVSLTDKGLTAMIATPNKGNLVIDRIPGTDRYISYFHQDLLFSNNYDCDVDDQALPPFSEDILEMEGMRPRPSDHCVEVHVECDNELYAYLGDVPSTVAFTEAVFNASAILYAMHEMYTTLSYVHVWDTADPFDDTNSNTGLSSLRSYFAAGNPKYGNLAHLLSGSSNNNGGLAYINSLCSSTYNVAYSNIDPSYNAFPSYSWTVNLFAHEMGHNFGSNHTHACVWNGNSTQIDDCGNKYYVDNGYPAEGAACYDAGNPILPANGGFIMSYCHLFSTIGVNYSLGFGDISGGTMYSNYANASCLSSCATVDCYAQEIFALEALSDASAAVSWLQVGSPDSFLVDWKSGAGPITTTTVYSNYAVLTGLQPATTYDINIYAWCGNTLSDALTGSVRTLCGSVESLPFSENFDGTPWDDSPEVTDPCWGFSSGYSGYYWAPEAATTPSGSTGPNADHTTGTGNYLFTEASAPAEQYDNGYLNTPLIDLTDVYNVRHPELHFWYSMYGSGMGSKEVYVQTGDTSYLVAQYVGQQHGSGTQWSEGVIDLRPFRGNIISVQFRATRGGSFLSDMAIDDISVIDVGAPTCDHNINTGSCEVADTGTTVVLLTGNNGCDSIVTTTTVLWPSYDIAVADSSANPNDTGTVVYPLTTFRGCDSTVTVTTTLISGPQNIDQDVSLTSGWNMISGYAMPQAADMNAVVSDISSSVIIIKNGVGDVALPSMSYNAIGDWDITQGYQIKANGPVTLTLTGLQALPENTDVDLQQQWNMISYLRTTPMDIVTALSDITSDIIIVKNNAGQIYAPAMSINTIGDMMPGQGYQIKMSASGTISYPVNARYTAHAFRPAPEVVHFELPENTGSNATILIPASLLHILSPGDEIAVLDANGRVAGAAAYDGRPMAISVWGDDTDTETKEYMEEGTLFQVMIWNSTSQKEIPARFSMLDGPDHYTRNGVSILKSLEIGERSTDVLTYQSLIYYPNPSSGLVTFEYVAAKTDAVRLTLFDLHGRKVWASENMPLSEGRNKIPVDLSAIPSGSYIFQWDTKRDLQTGAIHLRD